MTTLRESGVGVGVTGILGVGVGPYTFRLRNPDVNVILVKTH